MHYGCNSERFVGVLGITIALPFALLAGYTNAVCKNAKGGNVTLGQYVALATGHTCMHASMGIRIGV